MKRRSRNSPKKKRIIIATIVLLVVIAVVVYLITRPTTLVNTTTPATSGTPSATNASSGEAPDVHVPNPAPNPDPHVPGGSTTSGTQTVSTPTGTFISNHSTNLDPNSSRNQEQSVCNTTVGATCTITFTKSGVTKDLGPQVAQTVKGSQDGTAVWPIWTPLGIGLTQGVWQVKVTATLDGQSKSANDQLTVN